MPRYIDADRLKRQMEFVCMGIMSGTDPYNAPLNEIDEAPTADVVERKKGKWIEYVNSHCECPFCHKEWSFFENTTEWFNFCPNCGAQMSERIGGANV